MIEIRVARGHDVETRDAERDEGRHHHAPPEVDPGERAAGVDEQRAAPALHQGRVALPDVEGDEARWRRHHPHRRSDREGELARGHPEDARARPPRGERRGAGEGGRDEREGRRADRELGARPRGRGARERGEDAPADAHDEGCGGRQPARLGCREGGEPGDERGGQQHELGQRHRHEVREQGRRREPAEVEGDEGRGRREGRSRGAQARGDEGAQAPGGALALRVRRRLGRAGEEQGRGGREGELSARIEERLRLAREHGEGRRGDQRPGRRRAPQRERHAGHAEEHQRASHRDLEAGERGVAQGRGPRRRQRCAARIRQGARREAQQQAPHPREDERRHHREVEARHRQEMRQPGGAQRVLFARRELAAHTEREGGGEAGAPGCQHVHRRPAPRAARGEKAQAPAAFEAHGQGRIGEAPARGDARPPQPLGRVRAPGIEARDERAEAHPRAHPVPDDAVRERRAHPRLDAQPRPLRHRLRPAIRAPQLAEHDLERPAPLRARDDSRLDGGLDPVRGARPARRLAALRHAEPARRERQHERRRDPQPRAPNDQPEQPGLHEHELRADDPQPRAVASRDAESEGEREGRKDGQRRSSRDREKRRRAPSIVVAVVALLAAGSSSRRRSRLDVQFGVAAVAVDGVAVVALLAARSTMPLPQRVERAVAGRSRRRRRCCRRRTARARSIDAVAAARSTVQLRVAAVAVVGVAVVALLAARSMTPLPQRVDACSSRRSRRRWWCCRRRTPRRRRDAVAAARERAVRVAAVAVVDVAVVGRGSG